MQMIYQHQDKDVDQRHIVANFGKFMVELLIQIQHQKILNLMNCMYMIQTLTCGSRYQMKNRHLQQEAIINLLIYDN